MKRLLFSIIVLFNLLQGGISIIPFFIFNHIGVNYLIMACINMSFLFLFCRKIEVLPLSKFSLPLYLYLLVIFVNLLKFDRIEFSLSVLLNQISFFLLLRNTIFLRKHTLTVLLKPYLFYSLYNVFVIIFIYILITFCALNPYQNISTIYLFAKDNELAYFPYYLSIFRPDDTIRLAFFYVGGMICGLSHEPHVVAYICLPAFFILIFSEKFRRVRSIILIMYILFVFITFSATTILSFICVILVFLCRHFLYEKNIFATLLLIGGVLLLGWKIIGEVDLSFLTNKLTAEGGSRDYSIDRLFYAINPSTFLGSTIFTTDISGDVGLVTCILNIAFYVSFVFLIIKLLNNYRYIGFALAFSYLFFHSMKIILLVYSYPFILYMLFVLYHCFCGISIDSNPSKKLNYKEIIND